jgi:hypothetical protein
MKLWSSIFSFLFVTVTFAHAEKIDTGPYDFVVRINNEEIPLVMAGKLDLNSRRGDFNINFEIVASSSADDLANKTAAILKTVLPAFDCFTFKYSSIKIVSSDSDAEFNLDATVNVSQNCVSVGTKSADVVAHIGIRAATAEGNRLHWLVAHKPTIKGIPLDWQGGLIAQRAYGALKTFDLRAFFKKVTWSPSLDAELQERLQQQFDSSWFITMGTVTNALAAYTGVPEIKKIRASFQGANFGGNDKKLSYRIKADVHIDGKDVSSLSRHLLELEHIHFFNVTVDKISKL